MERIRFALFAAGRKELTALHARVVRGTVVAVAVIASSGVSPARAADECTAHIKEVPLGKKAAVADMWANWRENEGSIQAETKKMLGDAEKGLKGASAPEGLCPSGCKAAGAPEIKFTSIPAKFITGYSDEAHCNQLWKETENKPIRFDGLEFASIEEVTAWFGEFSQGKGKEGAALYAKCDGDCSPQYHCDIRPKGKGFIVNASAKCGAARDKDDNKYNLTVAYKYSCVAE